MVAGVAGTGKSTVGQHLAHRLGWEFMDGDDLHSSRSIAKMSRGEPLDDADRRPWLWSIGQHLDDWIAQGVSGVVACSALKRVDRAQLKLDRSWLRIAFLTASRDVIASRLIGRQGHFMKASMLDSQLAAEEVPLIEEDVLVLSAESPVPVIVDEIITMEGL
ncbi:Gluconokinase [Stackebrandtia soli]